jgi:hypothetical protein
MAQTLYPAPLTAILSAIAAQNKGVTLVPSQYTFGNPVVYQDPQGIENTSLLITVNDVSAPYQGAQTVYYRRLNLADLAILLPQPIYGHGWTTVADFWAVLNANFGLNFVPGDLNDSTALVIGSDGSGSVTLTAQPNSLGWIGSVTLPFQAGNYDLATVATGTTLSGLLYPNTDAGKPFGELYSYFRDMTPYQAHLQNYTTSSNDLTQLALDLKALTGNNWTNVAAAQYSLQGASVVYNGLVSDFVPLGDSLCTPNPAYQYVLIVKLNNSYSLGYSGYMFLHYGLIDPYANTDLLPPVKTAMLLRFDGINGSTILHDQAYPSRVLNANAPAAISTAQSLWGGSSLAALAAGANVTTADSAELRLTSDFTLEFDQYLLANNAVQVLAMKAPDNASSGGRIQMYSDGTLVVYADQDAITPGSQTLTVAANKLVLNQWQHIALVSKAGVWTLYVDGVPQATATATGKTWGNNAGMLSIGGNPFVTTAPAQAYLEEFRISNVARYSALFTPITDQFYVD